jgi:hypothetical protein
MAWMTGEGEARAQWMPAADPTIRLIAYPETRSATAQRQPRLESEISEGNEQSS